MASTYHGSHEYSTFSSSTISKQSLNADKDEKEENSNKFYRFICILCRLSSSLILHPLGPFRCIWDMFVMLLLIYTSIEIPYTMAFGQMSVIKYVGLFVDCCLIIDIFLNFHTAYFDKYDNLLLVTNKQSICKKYFRRWFFIDFVTCIPFDILISADDIHSNIDTNATTFEYIKILRICRLFRIVKILRLIKMLRIFDAFMKQFITRELIVFMKIAKIIFGMIMFAHFAACLWWYVGLKTSPSWIDVKNLRDNDHSTFSKYSYAWYWSVVTLFTTGYGDIVATNTMEQWICSIFILIGTCFFAYFVGTLTALITEGDKINGYELEKLEEAQSFCEKKKLPKELTRAVLTHIRYHFNYNYVFDESEILTLLPSYLQHDIHTYVAKQFLLKLHMFQNEMIYLPDFIIGAIAVKIKSVSCNQAYKLYDVNDIAKEFYIQRTGTSIMYDQNNNILHHLMRGSVCGEDSAFLFKKRRRKIECSTWSEFYAINIDDIKEILNLYYPKTSDSKWRDIQKYIKYAYKHNIKHTVHLHDFYTADHLEENPFNPTISKPMQQTLAYYEESVHIFDNTRKTSKPIPTNDGNLSIRIPTDDNKDIEMIDNNICLPSPMAANIEHMDHMDDTDDNNDGVNHKKKRSSGISKRLKIKSNSDIRNDVVVNHALKHQKSAMSKKQLPSSSSSAITTEMIVIHNNKYIADNREMFEQSDDSDSECSFRSITSHTESECSSDGQHHKANNGRYSRKKKIKKTRKKRKPGGKFGGRGNHHSGNIKQRKMRHGTGHPHKMRHRKKHAVSSGNHDSDNDEKPPKVIKQISFDPSIDEEALLAPLKKKETHHSMNEDHQITKSNTDGGITYMYNDGIIDAISIVRQSSQ